MRKLSLLLCLFIVLSCQTKKAVSEKGNTTTQAKEFISSTTIPIDDSVTKGVLSNGLTYYIKNNGKPENKVELRLVINAGSILEDDDQRGLAHFMEHMNFNGTKNFQKNELVDYLQSIGVKFGAHLNAYTSFDETVYILPIPSDDPEKLEKGFQILEDWAHNALLTEKDIDSERGVVLEELRIGTGANERMMQKYLPKVMFGSKYADRLPIGKKEIIENFKYESLIRFYKDWYRPDLMAVVAVGDVDVAVLEAKIKEHFGRIPKAVSPRKREKFSAKNHPETLICVESDKEAPYAISQIYYKDEAAAKKIITTVDYRNSLIENLFSQMISSRLDELKNSTTPPFIFASSSRGGTWARGRDAYQGFAVSGPDGQLKALQSLLEENERVKQFGFTQGELDRAKKSSLARMEKAFKDKDKTESRRFAGEFVRNFLTSETIPGIVWENNFYKKAYPSITLDDVNKLIQTYLKESNRVVVLTGPKMPSDKQVTESQVQQVLSSTKVATLTAYVDKVIASSLITSEPKPGAIVANSSNAALGTKSFTLSNGLKVVYKKTDFKNDEILMEGLSFGGTSLYSDEEIHTIGHANGGLTEAGINGFSKVDLSKMMAGKLARVRPYIYGITEGMRGSTTPKDIETLFQLTHLYFSKLNKDQEAYNGFINKQKSFIPRLLANPQTYFRKELGDFLNKGNKRYLGFPTLEALENSSYDLAYEKYQERFANAGDFVFYFVGNINEKQLMMLAAKYLGSLPGNANRETYKIAEFRALKGAHKKVIEKGQDPKSSVKISFQGETTYDMYEAASIRALGEILTIKLIENLREKEAGVYGAGARGSMSKVPYGSYNFSISFPCGPENVDKLTAAALKELKSIVDNGPTDKDLNKIKESKLLDYKEGMKKNSYWLSSLKAAYINDRDPELILKKVEAINGLNKKAIQAVAKKYLDGDYILAIHNPDSK